MKREGKSRYISLSMTEEEEEQNKTQVEKLYSEILEENLTPPEVKARLIENTTFEQKEKYVSVHRNKDKSHTWGAVDSKLLTRMKHSKYPDIDILLDLKVRLSTASRQYVENFIQKEGVSILIDIINSRLNRKAIDEFDAATIYEILLSCKLIMNYSIGMKAFLEVIGGLDCVARCLNFNYKPLAILVLEILSVSCYSESSTDLVVKGMKSMASIRGEAPFACLTRAIMDEDVEIKAAVIEFINCIVVGANVDTRALLRSNLASQNLNFHCEEALKQLDAELGAVEPMNGGRPALRKGVSVKKVVNVDKLGTAPLIALKGVRATSMRGSDLQINRYASDVKKKALSMSAMDDSNMPRGGALLVPFLESGCFGSKKVLPVRTWHSLDEEGFHRHAGDKETTMKTMTIPIGQIHDILESTMDRAMLKLIAQERIHVLEIVGESQTMTMGFQSKDDRDAWIESIHIFRDRRLISKSSYSMQRTYLELRDAIKCAERFRKLYSDYTSIAADEKQFSIDNCGIDVNDINVVYHYLRTELTAQGLENKLLTIFQELLLIPAQNEGAWDGIAQGIRNVVVLVKQGNDTYDESFQDKSIPELIREKAMEEGQSYANMSKIAISIVQKDQEIGELKDQIKQLESASNSPDFFHRKTIQLELQERQLPEVPPSGTNSTSFRGGTPMVQISDAIKEKLIVLFKKEPVVKALPDTGLTEEELKGLLGSDFALPTANDERYGKYVKMKQMLPEGAVKQKMKLDGFTDEEIDAFLSGNPLPPSIAASPAPSAGSEPAEDKYTKFDKMKKMLPEGAVRQKMKMEGISDEDIEAFFNGTLKRGGTGPAPETPAAPVVDPRYEKFEKMKKMLPEGAVRQKMAMEGFSQTEIDDFIAGKIPTIAAPAVAVVPAVDPRYEKFEKMKKILPEGAVRQKMAMEGFTQTEIDDFIAGKVPTAAVAPAAAPVADLRFEKFEKMKKMLPEGAVRQKMAMEGFSQTDIDDFIAGKVPTVAGAAPAAAAIPSKFEKFEKMKKMLPEGAVRQKMAMEGITQGEIDDFFAGKISESSSSSAVGGAGADPKAALKAGLAGALALKGKGGPGGVKVETKTPAAPPRVPKYSVKCKNIYWNKIPETDVKNTIWKDIKQFELNAQIKKEIEEWFAAKAAASAAAKDLATVTTVALAASKLHHSTKPKLVSLVDSKRTQNILIALGKIRRPPDEIAKIILELDPAVLTLEMTQSLLSILPTSEEFTTVKEYPNPDQLDKASIFVYELAKVPNIQQRLQTHEIIFTWFGQVNHIQTQLTAFQNACDELSKAQKEMETILAIILSIGNYVNDCTKFGDAVGIKLDTLMKLPTMKANNEQQYGNFLHFLALLLSKQYPEILKFSESFVSIWAAAELSFTQIVNDVAIVEKQVLKLTDDSQKIKDGKGEKLGATLIPLPPVPQPPSNGIAGNDNYYHNPLYRRIITFLNDAKPKLGNIKQQFKTVEHNLENIMNRFGESNKAMNEEDNAKQFFTIVTTFIKQLSKAHDDNVKKEQAKIRKAKIEKEKAEREKKRLERLSEKNGTTGGGTTGISRGNLTISQDEKTPEEGTSGKTPPRTPKGDGELELPDDNIFKDFFNRRSQSIEKTRNEFKNKLQRSVRFSTGFKVSTDEGDEDEGIILSPKSPIGSANAPSRKSAKQDFRKSATITELNEDEEEED